MTKLVDAFRSFANAPKDDWEVETVVTWWLIIQGTNWYQQGVEELLPRYDKYVPHLWRRRFGKLVDCRTMKSELFVNTGKQTQNTVM
jgi:hypothetical protein